jgi:hypothetical protein
VRFEFLPVHFEFTARDRIYFPRGKAANTLRGALGLVLNAGIFAPAAIDPGPSGLADHPRPFVFRARHLDGRTFQPGETFSFDLNVFALDPGVMESFQRGFASLSHRGLGPHRGKAEMRCAIPIEPVSLDLTPAASAPRKIRVEFLSPTNLKHDGCITDQPDFPILFGRSRNRISTLRALYGPGPLDFDFRGSGMRAADVRMTNCALTSVENERRSSRTG